MGGTHRVGFERTIYMKFDNEESKLIDCNRGEKGAIPTSRCLRYLMLRGRSEESYDAQLGDDHTGLLHTFHHDFDEAHARGELSGGCVFF